MTVSRFVCLGAVALSVAAAAPVALASTVLLFRTPSGNIGCVFSAGLAGAGAPTVRCDIRSRLRPEPRRPKRCRLDYGDSIEVSRTGRASLVCHGDTAIDPHSRVLAYGRTFRRDGVACTSRRTGLTCRTAPATASSSAASAGAGSRSSRPRRGGWARRETGS